MFRTRRATTIFQLLLFSTHVRLSGSIIGRATWPTPADSLPTSPTSAEWMLRLPHFTIRRNPVSGGVGKKVSMVPCLMVADVQLIRVLTYASSFPQRRCEGVLDWSQARLLVR